DSVVCGGGTGAGGGGGDGRGGKGMLLAGLGVFGISSLAGAFATTPGQLIAARAVMGLGAAMMFPATLSLLTNVFTARRERALAIGLGGASAGGGIALGPIAGGWVLERVWWGSIFLFMGALAAGVRVAGAHGARREHPGGRLAWFCPVHGRDEPDRVRDHPGARVGLGLGGDPRRARGRRGGAGGAGGGRASHRQPDDRCDSVPQPAVHRRARLPADRALPPACLHLPDHPLL